MLLKGEKQGYRVVFISPLLAMLALLAFVLRHYPALERFERSTRALSSFLLPPPSLLLSEACALGNIAWLDLIWAASCKRAEDRTPGWSLSNYLRSDPHYYRWQFARSLYAAAGKGNLAVVEWLFAHFSGCEAHVDVVKVAASGGHLLVLCFLWEHRSGRRTEAKQTTSECSVNFGEVYEGGRWYEDVIRKSIENGQLVQCLDDGMVLDEDDREAAIKEALRIGESELAERLVPSGRSVLDYATECTQPEMIAKVLAGGHLHWDEQRAADTLSHAARRGSCELMQQILQLHSPLQEDHSRWENAWWEALKAACSSGNMPALDWLVEHPLGREAVEQMKEQPTAGTLLGFRLFDDAVRGDNVEVMQYLYEKRLADLSHLATLDSIQEGQLNSVKWLVDHDMITDDDAFTSVIDQAAKYGRLDMLQVFQSLDQPGGYEAVGFKRRRLFCGEGRRPFYWAAWGGHVAVLEWLQANYPAECSTNVMDIAAASGHLDAVKWLHANRTEGCTTTAMYRAVEYGHFEVVKWLYVHRPESRTPNGIVTALASGHLRIAFWLHSKFPGYRVNDYNYKSLFRATWYVSYPLEALLFLRAIYPNTFAESFVQNVLEDCGEHVPSFLRVLTVNWLKETYPSMYETAMRWMIELEAMYEAEELEDY